jgi:hypothetical protein
MLCGKYFRLRCKAQRHSGTGLFATQQRECKKAKQAAE